MPERSSVSLERPLADGDKLVATIELDGEATTQPPSGWTLSVNDLIETRHGGERMYISRSSSKMTNRQRKATAGFLIALLIVWVALLYWLFG